MARENFRSISDFLDDEEFRSWVLMGVNNEYWSSWLEEHPEAVAPVHEARNFLLAIGRHDTEVSDLEVESALASTLGKISNVRTSDFSWLQSFWWRCAVASVLMVIGVYLNIYLTSPGTKIDRPSTSTRPSTSILTNHGTTPKTFNLIDGSSVILQTGASLSIPGDFNIKNRKVTLTGDAFFEVHKNREKPFVVYSGPIAATVTGTSFAIRAGKEKEILVYVKSGKVNISPVAPAASDQTKQTLELVESETATFDHGVLKLLEKSESYQPQQPAEYLRFDFTDTPVSEIFDSIENAYGMKVEYPTSVLADCYLSTNLSDEPLLEKLKIICESLGGDSQFSITANNMIKIQTNGCNP